MRCCSAKQSSSEVQILVGGGVPRPGAVAQTSEFSGEMTDLGASQEEGDIGLTAEWRTGHNTEHGHSSGESLPGQITWLRLRWGESVGHGWLLGINLTSRGRKDHVFVSVESELCDKKESASVT